VLRNAIRFTLAIEILLVCFEGVIPGAARYLPLGGSHLSQLGLILGLGIAASELCEVTRHTRPSPQKAPESTKNTATNSSEPFVHRGGKPI
jgi:hypothetical protein